MHSAATSNPLRVAFVGAGLVNFGGGEGPWDHASRIEQIARQMPIAIVGIADCFVQRAHQVLAAKRANVANEWLWADTAVFSDYEEMIEKTRPDAVFIGVPPYFHGSTEANRDIELVCARNNIHMFIEKPISCGPLDDVETVTEALQEAAQRGLVVSVGYMFRYSKAIRKMKEIIEEHGPPRAWNARYNCAYSTISKLDWWDTERSGGPIVEQATHFVDLARFLVGEVDLKSVQAVSLKQSDPLGQLSKVSDAIHEEHIPIERRLPRVTSSFWRFESGAIGSLMHGALLHGTKYASEIEVWGDGYRMVPEDPYSACILSVRFPGKEDLEVIDFSGDDYYHTQNLAFLQAVATGDKSAIQSPYTDSANTYKLTVTIREAAA
jgi:predicted dehydrogenase